jgi:hypothetical protein
VFLQGLKEDTGLLKVCVIAKETASRLCHYMESKEESQLISPNVSVHAGIFVFPSFKAPVDTDVDICVYILNDGRTVCKTIQNNSEGKEEMIDIRINQ